MKANLMKTVKKTELLIKQYSPEILKVTAVTTGILAVARAIKDTMELEEEIAPVKEKIETIKNDISVDEATKGDLTKAYGEAAVVIVKNYWDVIALETISITSLLAATNIMKKRNAGLIAAYSSLDALFKQYRKNVIAELGEEKDYMFLHNLHKEKVEVEETDPETGKTKKVKKDILVKNQDSNELSMYSRLFQVGNVNYTDSPSLNRAFIMGIQKWANRKLRADGYLFLSDVELALGFEQSEAGRVVGWKYDPNYDSCEDYIQLGIFDAINDMANLAADENDICDPNSEIGEAAFWLDFNVDGVILDIFRKGPTARRA